MSPALAADNTEGESANALDAVELTDAEESAIFDACQTAVAQESSDQVATGSYDFTCNNADPSLALVGSATAITDIAAQAPTGNVVAADPDVDLNCDATEPPYRNIVNSSWENLQFCVIYGQINSPTYGTWSRSIWTTWSIYPGWNSTSTTIQTTPSGFENPTLQGTLNTRSEPIPGVVIPAASSLWSNTGATTTWGWVVGGTTSGGSYSTAVNDFEVTLSSRGFNYYIGNEIASHRFSCDSELEWCSWPNGEEAGW